MTVKCTGAEFKACYTDQNFWFLADKTDQEGTWHDDDTITIDGRADDDIDASVIRDDAKVEITGGIVFGPVVGAPEPSLEGYFKRWKKTQNTAKVLVSCDKSVLDAVIAAIKAAGGRVEAC